MHKEHYIEMGPDMTKRNNCTIISVKSFIVIKILKRNLKLSCMKQEGRTMSDFIKWFIPGVNLLVIDLNFVVVTDTLWTQVSEEEGMF